MSVNDLPTTRNAQLDHALRSRGEVYVAPLIDIHAKTSAAPAAQPSLEPDLYIYNISNLVSSLGNVLEHYQATLKTLDGNRDTLSVAFTTSMINGMEAFLDTLKQKQSSGDDTLIVEKQIHDFIPENYGYAVRKLPAIFEQAHNFAHQRVLAARAGGSVFTGAYETELKSAAQDHATADTARTSGLQYLKTPVMIEGTCLTPKNFSGSLKNTLTALRDAGLARPMIYHG